MKIRVARLAKTASLLGAGTLCAGAQMPVLHAPQETGSWGFHHENVLGTSLEMRVQARNRAEAECAESAALEEFDRQELILSAWRPESEFSRWTRTRFEPVAVSPELYEMLAAFDWWRERTGGVLDASAEAAAQMWKQALLDGRMPTDVEIASTREAMQQAHWQLDGAQRTATRLSAVPLALASFAKSTISSAAAEAALRSGATGVMVNLGGDIVVRGSMQQTIDIVDPRAAAENDRPLDRIWLSKGAVATSGSYRRGLDLKASAPLQTPEFSHLFDPRTARPASGIVSSTVIAPDAQTAGALATAFSILRPEESETLAAQVAGVAYMLVTADGHVVRNESWARQAAAPGLRSVVYAPAMAPHNPELGMWDPHFDLSIAVQLPRIEDARYRRPYLAVWVEDADHFPVRTLALWTQNPRWLPELKQWYRDDQIRNLSEGTDVSKTVSSATRPPGRYSLRWDGKDNEGKYVKAGRYTVVIEASREHGGYQVERKELDFDGQAAQATLEPGKELGAVTLDYGKR